MATSLSIDITSSGAPIATTSEIKIVHRVRLCSFSYEYNVLPDVLVPVVVRYPPKRMFFIPRK